MAEQRSNSPSDAEVEIDNADEWLKQIQGDVAAQEPARRALEQLLRSSKKVTRVSKDVLSIETLHKYGVPYSIDEVSTL